MHTNLRPVGVDLLPTPIHLRCPNGAGSGAKPCTGWVGGTKMRLPSLPDRSVWRNGPFVRLWVAQALTQTTQNAIWYALLVLVEDTSHSTTQLGLTILSVVIPSVFFGVPAGVYVDRWDKRMVLVISNLGRALIVVGYVLFGSVLALLYLVSFAFSMASQFFAPAELAMIPAVVQLLPLCGQFAE